MSLPQKWRVHQLSGGDDDEKLDSGYSQGHVSQLCGYGRVVRHHGNEAARGHGAANESHRGPRRRCAQADRSAHNAAHRMGLHFGIGIVVWGTLFAVLYPRLPGSVLIRGVLFGIGAWILMMVMFLPIAGQGLFGISGGMVVPVMTLMLHLIYGAVLGLVFGKLSAKSDKQLQTAV
ncbi:MAG: DUF6789 family protein [Geminicoccaceae bacterium]